MQDPALPYSAPIAVADIPPAGATRTLEPNALTRAALARHAGIPSVDAFRATFTVTPRGTEDWTVEGRLHATATQVCVLTSEPFPVTIDEEIRVDFTTKPPVPVAPGEEVEILDEDPPDLVTDGRIDLGALAVEFLLLGLDPYPKKPGAVFEPLDDPAAEKLNPFAVLKTRNDPA